MIKFLCKIAAQHALSAPLLNSLYRPIREGLTGSTVVSPGRIRQKVEIGLMYLDRVAGSGLGNLTELGPILDFGGGWHLTIPLLYARLGARSQLVTDTQRLASPDLVFAARRELNKLDLASRPSHPLPEPDNRERLDDYLSKIGIRYQAPVSLPLPIQSGSIACVLCTQVLTHPAAPAVRAIFEEMARALKPGGIATSTIHLYDMYSDFDRSLSDSISFSTVPILGKIGSIVR